MPEYKDLKQHEENDHKLNSCKSPHEFKEDVVKIFTPAQDGTVKLEDFTRYRCTKCKGLISDSDYQWYQEGIKDGKL